MKVLAHLFSLILSCFIFSCSSEYIVCSDAKPSSCIGEAELKRNSKDLVNPEVLTSFTSREESSEIGNFVTTAIQRAYNLDFVFLPASQIRNMNTAILVKPGMTEAEIKAVVNQFPRGPRNQLQIGTMKGKNIKEFIINRSREIYAKELETAGLWYSLVFRGGFKSAEGFSIDGRFPVNDDEYYKIAISDDFFFGSAFPGYRFRNAFNFNFKRERYEAYINEAVETYLNTISNYSKAALPYWPAKRAQVLNYVNGDLGYKTISEIQGRGHTSLLSGFNVKTKGIVTAVATDQWYPYYYDVYIQSRTPDSDPLTSDAIHLTLIKQGLLLKIGDEIEVEGLVIEDLRVNGMGETNLRVNKLPKILSRNNILPKATLIGPGGREIPNKIISGFNGNLMRKSLLNLNEGIDFWESLEGMRVKLSDLVIVGFRGGGEDLITISNRFYLNLQVTPEGSYNKHLKSKAGGLLADFINEDFNPEVVTITTNHLSRGVKVDRSKGDFYYYNVGDKITGEVEGVLTYHRNLFGGGEYAIVTPEPQESLVYRNIETKGFIPVSQRGTTIFGNDDNEITFATFNLENLPGNREDRIKVVGDVIAENLNCPDVMNLVEIQDNNGISLRGNANAEQTLNKLVIWTQSKCPHKNYDFVNIDPFLQAEGGQPGGNIRVSMFFNSNKLSYTKREDGSVGSQANVSNGGLLTSNPGRIFPIDPAFHRTRRSFVVEFDVLSKPGEKIYVIGNHLNSKLGDIDLWGSVQPAVQGSDEKRARRAAKVNQFIRWVETENPNANIVVLGDFNALAEEGSMQVLAGKQLRNMIFTLPPNERYTTIHNGNSQPLDYIFVNHKMFEKDAESEVLHINSDFMGRVSDHDPVILKVKF